MDPVWSDRASPFSFAGPKRVNAPGITLTDLPRIDAILLTHNHYDHMDVAAISRIANVHRPRILVPLANDTILRQADRTSRRCSSRAIGARASSLSDRVRVTLEPSLHWSARWMSDRFMALWCNFVVETPAGRIYACGDTGYDPDSIFPVAGRKYGGFRLALLPIGAYEPRWFMKEQHMNPEEAVKVYRELGAEAAIGHHWGTFRLTNEGVERPREALAVALAEGQGRSRPVPRLPARSGLRGLSLGEKPQRLRMRLAIVEETQQAANTSPPPARSNRVADACSLRSSGEPMISRAVRPAWRQTKPAHSLRRPPRIGSAR